jgi:hypothetical protein
MRDAHRHPQTPDAGAPVEILRYSSLRSERHEFFLSLAPYLNPSSCFCVILSEAKDLARSALRYANMARRKKFLPLHPGAILREDFVVPTGISIHRLAMDLRVPANRIAESSRVSAPSPQTPRFASPAISVHRRNSGSDCKATTISKKPRTS